MLQKAHVASPAFPEPTLPTNPEIQMTVGWFVVIHSFMCVLVLETELGTCVCSACALPELPLWSFLLAFILPASFHFPEQSASIVSLRKSCGNFPTEHKSKNLCKVIWETSALRTPARGVWLRLRAWKPGIE